MSLINCTECNKEISDKVKSCPHCGYPFEDEKDIEEQQVNAIEVETNAKLKKSKKNKVVIITSILIFIVLLSGIVFYTQKIQLNKYESYSITSINKIKNATNKTDKLIINSVDFLAPIEIVTKNLQPEVEKIIAEYINSTISKEYPACVISFEIQKNENDSTFGYILSVYSKESKEYKNIGMCMTLDESMYEKLYELDILSFESMKEQHFTAIVINCINTDKNKVGNVSLNKIRKAIED